MLRVNQPFMDCVLWPEYRKYEVILDKLTEEILTDLISKIHLVNDEDETVIAGELPLATAASAL